MFALLLCLCVWMWMCICNVRLAAPAATQQKKKKWKIQNVNFCLTFNIFLRISAFEKSAAAATASHQRESFAGWKICAARTISIRFLFFRCLLTLLRTLEWRFTFFFVHLVYSWALAHLRQSHLEHFNASKSIFKIIMCILYAWCNSSYQRFFFSSSSSSSFVIEMRMVE